VFGSVRRNPLDNCSNDDLGTFDGSLVYFETSLVVINAPKAPQPFGVHSPLGNALAVLVREFLDELIILHEKRTARASGDRVLVIGDRRPRRWRSGVAVRS
jgi:hypothetical protein